MAGFLSPHDFHSEAAVQALPMRFERTADGRYLVSNMVGDFAYFSNDEFRRLVELNFAPDDPLYAKAYASHLITRQGQTAQLQLLAMRLRSRMSFQRGLQPVVEVRTSHHPDEDGVAERWAGSERGRTGPAAPSKPAQPHKIEFRVENLFDFHLIDKSSPPLRRRARAGKRIQFVIASNLALLTDDILSFCKTNEVLLSTSLDGPADLHNKNRPRPGGNSYELAVRGIKRATGVPWTRPRRGPDDDNRTQFGSDRGYHR